MWSLSLSRPERVSIMKQRAFTGTCRQPHQKQVKHGVDIVEVALLPIERRVGQALCPNSPPLSAVDINEVSRLRRVKGLLVLLVELSEEVEELVDPVKYVVLEELPQELWQHDGIDEVGVGGTKLADEPLDLFKSLEL